MPREWTHALVIPIFKKGDKYDPANYRPISLTCSLCKILEKIVVREMTPYLVENKVITLHQHGFLPRRSTATNLLECLNNWTKHLDGGQPVDVIYLDYQKAFDRVPFGRLLYKLHHYGIRGGLLSWIDGLLRKRTFQVRVEGCCSGTYEVLSGVPQGSVIGPLLFLAYISDLPLEVSTNISLFADDTKLYCNPLTQLDDFLKDVRMLEEWTSKWLLTLNESKCTVLHLGRNNPRIIYTINGTVVKSVSSQRDLGVVITEDLKWETHINCMVKKANSLVYMVKKAFSDKSISLVGKVYRSFIRPKLEYCHSIWNPYYSKDIELVERVQRRVTKIPTEMKSVTYEERIKLYGIPTLKARRDRGDLIETFKILNGDYHLNPGNDFFIMSSNRHLRGHSKKLSTEKCSSLTRKNFLTNRVVYRWNVLGEPTVGAPNKNIFKNRLDEQLKEETDRVSVSFGRLGLFFRTTVLL